MPTGMTLQWNQDKGWSRGLQPTDGGRGPKSSISASMVGAGRGVCQWASSGGRSDKCHARCCGKTVRPPHIAPLWLTTSWLTVWPHAWLLYLSEHSRFAGTFV